METKSIKALKKGDLFCFFENGPVWVRGSYERSLKKFDCTCLDDCYENFFVGSVIVFVFYF